MSTPYINIFKKYNAETTDANLFTDLTDAEMTELLDIFLSKSKSIYFKNCTKNLTDVETYDYYSKKFTADGISNEFVIDRYPFNPHEDAILMFCKVNDVDITTYVFDHDTLTFTITPKPALNDMVICGYDFSGQFNSDLTEEEEWVLVGGMQISWLNRQILKEEKLRDRLSTKDYDRKSPANLLDKLISLRNEIKKDLRGQVIDYSFSDFSGFN